MYIVHKCSNYISAVCTVYTCTCKIVHVHVHNYMYIVHNIFHVHVKLYMYTTTCTMYIVRNIHVLV